MTTLSESEEMQLRLFRERLQELLESPIAKKPRKRLEIWSEIISETNETTVVLDVYDDETVRAFFTIFRQFTMKKEKAVYVKNVCKLIIKKCDRDELVTWTRWIETKWEEMLNGPTLTATFHISGKVYSNIDLM